MRFAHPQNFQWMLLLPALIVLIAWGFKRKRKLLALFCGADLASRLAGETYSKRQKLKATLLILAIACLLTAMARPQWGFQWEDLRQEGIDIVIAIDVSKSMLAEDIKPNRLTRAKFKVADLLRMLEGDRIGLTAFAGTAFLQCPLTLDYTAAELFLDAIDTSLIPTQGTAIGLAINTSLKAFNPMEKNSKAVILITDGEDHGGDALTAAERAKEEGVRIYTIGIGENAGAPIPEIDKSGFKKNLRGEVVLSKLDESLLQEIALKTGGVYVRSISGDLDLKKIYIEEIKGKIEKKELTTTRKKMWRERFQWFLLPALILLCLEFALPEAPRREDN
jgi:Ca-activated chloride channel family protein